MPPALVPAYASIENNTASKWWKDPGLKKMILVVVILWGNSFSE
jgi:hypothetical protein